MDNIERAIRSALEKTDARNIAARQRVYESAWGAQERALTANKSLTDPQKEQRRQGLRDLISSIEQEYVARREEANRREPELAAVSLDDPILSTGSNPALNDTHSNNLSLDAGEVHARSGRKRVRATSSEDAGAAKRRTKKRHSLFYNLGIPVLVLAVAGMIGYSLYNSYLDFNRRPASNPLHNDSSLVPTRAGQDADGVRWVNIFTPSEAERMSVQGRATATIQTEGTTNYARIQSGSASDSVAFDIGEGILDQLVGKKATFDIVARTPDGQRTQIAVDCDLAGLGDCGRRRYDVNDSMSDLLFDLDFPAGKTAGRSGRITINTDITGGGKPVDIYAIRVTTDR